MILIQFLLLGMIFKQGIAKECNQVILNSFNLTGMKWSFYGRMKICPRVIDTCCAIQDEIKIFSFWNNVTKPKLIKRHSAFTNQLLQIVNRMKRLRKFDYSKIQYRYLFRNQDKYNFKKIMSKNEYWMISPLNLPFGGYMNLQRKEGWIRQVLDNPIDNYPGMNYYRCVVDRNNWNMFASWCPDMGIWGDESLQNKHYFLWYVTNMQLFDFTYMCIERDIIRIKSDGWYEINPSSWQFFHWFYWVWYCEFLTIKLFQEFFTWTNRPLRAVSDQFYLYWENIRKI